MNLSDAEFYSIAEAKAKFSKVIDDSKTTILSSQKKWYTNTVW